MIENIDEIFVEQKIPFFAKKCLTFRKKKSVKMQARTMPHRIVKRRKKGG